MMNLQERWVWFKGLKWWEKVLAAIPFLLIVVCLVLVYVFRPPTPTPTDRSDQAETNLVNNAVNRNEAKDKELVSKIEAGMKELDKLKDEARIADGKALEAKEAIKNAKSFEEIDAILRGLRQ